MNNFRIILFPMLTYRGILKNHTQIEQYCRINIFQMICINLINEFGFLQMIQTHKPNIYRVNFKNLLEAKHDELIKEHSYEEQIAER